MRSGQRKACPEVEGNPKVAQPRVLLLRALCGVRSRFNSEFLPNNLLFYINQNSPRRAAMPFPIFYSTVLQRPCFHRRARGHLSPRHSRSHGHRSYAFVASAVSSPVSRSPSYPPLPGHIPRSYLGVTMPWYVRRPRPCLGNTPCHTDVRWLWPYHGNTMPQVVDPTTRYIYNNYDINYHSDW